MAKKKKTRQPTVTKMTVASAVNDAFTQIEELRSELEEWYENLPENFQNGEKGERLQDAIQCLEDSEPDVSDDVAAIEFEHKVYPSHRTGRAHRRDEAVALLEAVKDALGAGDDNVEMSDEAQALIDELDNAISDWENAEFPGMYG